MLFFLFFAAAIVAGRWAYRQSRKGEGVRRWLPWSVVALASLGAVAFAPRSYVLVKFVGALAMPFGLAWSVLLATTVYWYYRDLKRWALAGWVAVLVLGLVGSPPVAALFLGSLEAEVSHVDPRRFERDRFDVIIVLGGGTTTGPQDQVGLGPAGDRVMLAARLYRRGVTPMLAASGSPIPGFSRHDAVQATTTIWRELGVGEDAIVRVQGAHTTLEEAQAYQRLIPVRGWERIGLLSSAWHLPRAMRVFARHGIECSPIPADFRSVGPIWQGPISLIPSGAAAGDMHRAAWEYVGRLR